MDQNTQLEIVPERSLQHFKLPPLPHWPTSKPGPRVTEPPIGTKRMPLRTEQTVAINYDQELGRHISDQ